MVQLLWMLTTGIHTETPRVSLMGCHEYWWLKFHVCQGDKILQAYMFDSSMHVATTSALTWCIVVDLVLSPSTSLLRQLPKNYSMLHACFRILEAGVREDVWRWFWQFLMKGLVRWVLPFLLYEVFPFRCMLVHGGRCIWHMTMVLGNSKVTALKIWMVEVSSALMYIEDMRHAL